MDKTIIVLTTAYKAGQRKGCDAWELAGGRAKLPPLGDGLEGTMGPHGGCARGGEKEKEADFLVDYKRFTPRVTKAFTEGDIVHVVEDDRRATLSPAGTSEFLSTPSDGHSGDLALSPHSRISPRRFPSRVFHSLKVCEWSDNFIARGVFYPLPRILPGRSIATSRDEQTRILSSGQRSSRSWVNYVSINIPYCVTKYSVGIHRAPEPHELFNRWYTLPPSSLNIEKTPGGTPGSSRISPRKLRFLAPISPRLHPSFLCPPPSSMSVFLFFT